MPASGSRVFLVNFPVCHAVEGHGRRSREDHGKKNQQNDPHAGKTVGGDDHRSRSKWQGKDRMGKSDEFQNALDVVEHGWKNE
jgi:hypothetical protein